MTISIEELKERIVLTEKLAKAEEKLNKLKSVKTQPKMAKIVLTEADKKTNAKLFWTQKGKDWIVSKENIFVTLPTKKGDRKYEGVEFKKGDVTKIAVYTRGNSCLATAWN